MTSRALDAVFVILLAFFTAVGIAYSLSGNDTSHVRPPARSAPAAAEGRSDPFGTLSLTAKSAIVYDLALDRVLYEKNANARLPLASLTKVMAALTARELLGDGENVPVTAEAVAVEGDTGLYVGENWSAKDLLAFSLLTSSNDGIKAASSRVFDNTRLDLVAVMNNKARLLGLTQTKFNNVTGLDVNDHTAGAYGSARDYAALLSYAVGNHYDLIHATARPQDEVGSREFEHAAENTNPLAGRIPSLIASKTGFTDLAGGNLGIVFETEPGHPVVVVVLGSTIEERFTDVTQLVWAAIGS